ncbi:MAG TPA: CRISPR-associated protein Cas5 [Candidatus Deferrimicrobium sp.]|nr:CRISPR-associated protein Cas5 [Candidatus Deferrimicrobium sp.]
MKNLDRLICFKISGKFAHFRKFYTNASSLSYLVPPRTVITGMLGSILKLPRDSYYDLFNGENCNISVAIAPTAFIKKSTQSLNLLHLDYYKKILANEGARCKSIHSPCKMELLVSTAGRCIEYLVYVAFSPESSYCLEVERKLKELDCGFGIYLGQRQFRADIEYLQTYGAGDILPLEQAESLDSLCLRENVLELSANEDLHIISEHMPLYMKQVPALKKLSAGRETASVKGVLFERNGKRIYGRFKNCCQIGDKVISFY